MGNEIQASVNGTHTASPHAISLPLSGLLAEPRALCVEGSEASVWNAVHREEC